MFTHQQIQHFKAFGFVVARGLLADDEVHALRTEVVSALTDAFGGVGTDVDPDAYGGIRVTTCRWPWTEHRSARR